MPGDTTGDIRTKIRSNPLWYHTMELAPGVLTPGWFDLRTVIPKLPWPDLQGKRCLDIGTFDGHLAFEMERRGAAEVVCTDVASHAEWDHLPRQRSEALRFWSENAGEKGLGFKLAAQILDSKVRREWVNVYDLSPERLGTFDVVVCGTLLLHLRAPFAALEAIRSVTDDVFMSAEQIDLPLSVMSRRRAALHLEGDAGRWFIANAAGHRRLLEIAGFDVERVVDPYVVPFGSGHPPVSFGSARRRVDALATRWLCGDHYGVPHSALLARKAVLA